MAVECKLDAEDGRGRWSRDSGAVNGMAWQTQTMCCENSEIRRDDNTNFLLEYLEKDVSWEKWFGIWGISGWY